MGQRQVLDVSKARVTYPDGEFSPDGDGSVRFVFHGGRAAVWLINRKEGTARRVLLAFDTVLTPRTTARDPHILTLANDTVWQVLPLPGGGCGCVKGVTRNLSWDQLLDPDRDTIP